MFPKLCYSSALHFQGTAHTPLLLAGWGAAGAALDAPAPCTLNAQAGGKGWAPAVWRDRGPHGCCIPWGQQVTNTTDSSPATAQGAAPPPSQASLHLCGNPGVHQVPLCTQKPRWLACLHLSETFLRYLPTIPTSSLRDLLVPVLSPAFLIFSVKYTKYFGKLSPSPYYGKDNTFLAPGLFWRKFLSEKKQ